MGTGLSTHCSSWNHASSVALTRKKKGRLKKEIGTIDCKTQWEAIMLLVTKVDEKAGARMLLDKINKDDCEASTIHCPLSI